METSSHASPGRVRARLDHPIDAHGSGLWGAGPAVLLEGPPVAGAVAAVRAEAGPAPVGR